MARRGQLHSTLDPDAFSIIYVASNLAFISVVFGSIAVVSSEMQKNGLGRGVTKLSF